MCGSCSHLSPKIRVTVSHRDYSRKRLMTFFVKDSDDDNKSSSESSEEDDDEDDAVEKGLESTKSGGHDSAPSGVPAAAATAPSSEPDASPKASSPGVAAGETGEASAAVAAPLAKPETPVSSAESVPSQSLPSMNKAHVLPQVRSDAPPQKGSLTAVSHGLLTQVMDMNIW